MSASGVLQCVNRAAQDMASMPACRRAWWLASVLEELEAELPEDETRDLLWSLVKGINGRLTYGRW